jgi:CheY-like chemotaxis protein
MTCFDFDPERDGAEEQWARGGRAGVAEVGAGAGPWITLGGATWSAWGTPRTRSRLWPPSSDCDRDVVLMDVRLPDRDGICTTAELLHDRRA